MVSFLSSRPRLFSASLLLLSFCLLAGCKSGSGDKFGTVTGKVTIGGAPANSGSVVFAGASGATISGTIEADGTYRAVQVPVGEAKVTVVPAPSQGGTPNAPVTAMKDMPSGSAITKPVPIPAKYGQAASSGLTYTVKSGENKYDIDLAK